MKFVKLTDPEGVPVWIAAQWVTKVRVAQKDYVKGAVALVSMGASSQAVREEPEAVVRMIEQAGDDC